MTTKWTIPADLYAGETVVILAPTAAPALAAALRQHIRIAVRRAAIFAPDADMLVSLDGPTGSFDDAFWADVEDFEGLKVCGTECDDLDALYPGLLYERVRLGEGHEIEIRNNGLAAIRIAALAGARRILLVGFDTEAYERAHGFVGLTAGVAQITAELALRGIAVEHYGADPE